MAERSPPKNSIPAPFHPGDRATAPMALEETSLSAWHRFEELQKAHEKGFQTTQAASKMQTVPAGFEATQPMDAPLLPPFEFAKAAPAAPVTLEEVMVLARRNNRACPVPERWAAFHALLPERVVDGRSLRAPPPIVGAAWAASSEMQKRLRLRDQIEWAERAGALAVAHEFLAALPEEGWHHF